MEYQRSKKDWRFYFLGIENTLSLDSEDLDFLDVLTKHASEALIKTKAL